MVRKYAKGILPKTKSRIRYSRARAYEKNLEAVFSQFLHPSRVDCASSIFYACCELEMAQSGVFTVGDIMGKSRIIEGAFTEARIRRTVADLERMGLMYARGTKRLRERFYELTVRECGSGLVRQSKQIKNIYKRIQSDLRKKNEKNDWNGEEYAKADA